MFVLVIVPSACPQAPLPSGDLYARFDNEHDLARKELLLGQITDKRLSAGPTLLNLAEHTTNSDTRWMAMRGMATVRYEACAEFLETSLKDPDGLVRANAARALSDLRVTASGHPNIQVMFAAEKDPRAIEQASLALRVLNVRSAVPYVRIKIPQYTWQTRTWLLQALGALGSSSDVPLIAGYLNSSDMASAMAATAALEELTGISFGLHREGPSGYPTAEMLAARDWWKSHKAAWPSCDDCHYRKTLPRGTAEQNCHC
jgi:hypothetical protein